MDSFFFAHCKCIRFEQLREWALFCLESVCFSVYLRPLLSASTVSRKSSAGLTGPWGRSCCQREPLSSCSSQKQKPSPWHTVLTPPITTNTRLGTEGGLCKKKKAQETVPLQGAPIKTFLGKANVNPTRCGEDDTPCCTGQFYSSFSKILTLPLNRKRKEEVDMGQKNQVSARPLS